MLQMYGWTLLSIALGEIPLKDDIVKEYQTREAHWHASYVDKMRNFYPHGEITKGYLDTFLYRPVRLSAADRLGGVPEGELLIYNNILGESYYPLFLEKDGIRMEVIELIPGRKVNRARKNPEWWFSRGRDRKKRVTLYKPLAPVKGTLSVVLRLGKGEPESVSSSQMILQVEKFHSSFTDNADRFSKYIIDGLVEQGNQTFSIENDATEEHQALFRAVENRVQAYFRDMPIQPDEIRFRDNQRNVSFRYELFLKNGEIWIRSNPRFTGRREAWMKLKKDYLPKNRKIVELSTDGVAFIVKDEEEILWRSGELFEAPKHWKWHRNMGWLGLPFLSRNYMKSTDAIMWEVTDASLRVNLYEDDLAANQHPFLPGPDGEPGGIAQMYALAKDRRNIYSNDYWVSTDWRRISCGPFRSRLKIQSLSSSGSTMFVISEKGDMFTRYWNYNTSGASAPTNLYTLDPERSKPGNFFTTRLLPTEPWYQQPPINGQITDRISIFSTGHAGNQARLLRVEGKKGGRTGYFEKLIYEPDWRFVPTDVSVERPFMDNRMRDESSIQSFKEDGLILSEEELQFVGKLGEFSIRLHDFHLNCAPAYLEIQYQGVSVFLIVHAALESPISSKKGNYYRKRGEVNRYRIYMELPEQYWDPNMNSLEVRSILRYLKQRWKHDDGRYFWGHVHASEDKAIFKPKRSLGGLFAPGKASLQRMEQTKAAD